MTTILFFIEGMNFGGQQTFSFNVLKNLDRSKYKLIVAYIFEGELKDKFVQIADEVVQLGEPYDPFNAFKYKSRMLKMGISYRRLFQEKNVDVVISNGFVSYFTACFATAFLKTKHIRFIGGDLTKNEPFHFNNKRFHLLPLHRFTDLFIGYNYILGLLEKKGVSKDKLNNLFFRSGVDSDLFSVAVKDATVNQMLREINVPKGNLTFGWLGRIEKNMEIRYTLKLAIELKKQGFEDYNFVIIGDGNWKSELIKIAKENEVFDKLRFLGYISQKKLPVLLKMIDIMPLLDVDPHGGSILRESMAAGICVMTVDGKSGEQRNIIEHMKTGILVEKDDFVKNAAKIIMDLSDKPEIIESMAKEGQIFAQKYLDFNVISQGLEKAIDKLTRAH